MDVLKFLQEGNVRKNPEYNPKTKKGSQEAPLLVDYNVGDSIEDKSKEIISNILSRSSYELSKYGDKNYANYNVYINPINTEEELNKERAQNQSGFEQLGRLTAQVVGSEVVLGTLRGFSDLADYAYNTVNNLITNENNDYTNPISQALEEAQEAYRERFEIYRENPDKAFDFSDFGWWTGNAVSIASTLSLLIPGTAFSKLGKLAGIGKLGRGIGKMAGKVVGKPAMWGEIGEQTANIATTALGSRIAENYIEARDVYTQTYDEIKSQLSSMTEEDRKKFYERYPKLKGLDDDSIAKYLAGESADDTFKGDMWLMLMDMAQLKALKNFWIKSPSVTASNKLIQENIQSSARLVGMETPTLTRGAKVANWFKNNIKNIVTTGSEGIEEGWQYYQQQYGIDKARNAINNEYKIRSIVDNLKDPHLQENAFWGWLGGLAFQGIASKSKEAFNKYILKNKNVTEEARLAEINSREAHFTEFANRMKLLNEGFNPDSPVLDEEGKPLTDNNGNTVYQEIDNATSEAMKEAETERLITNLTLEAADKGNYDLLKRWLTDDNFKQYFTNTNILDEQTSKVFIDNIAAKMDNVYETYSKEVQKVANNDVINQSIIAQIAKENTYNKLAINEQRKIKDNYQTEINNTINNITNETIRQRAAELERQLSMHGVKTELDNLEKQDKDNDKALKKKEINKLKHKINKTRIQNIRETLLKDAGYDSETTFNTDYSNVENYDKNRAELDIIDSTLGLNMIAKHKSERMLAILNNYINDTNDKIKNREKELENEFKFIQGELYEDELERLNNIFRNNNINNILDYLSGNKNINIDDNVKNELDDIEKKLDLFNPSSELVVDVISNAAKRIQKEKNNKPKANINGENIDVDLNLEEDEIDNTKEVTQPIITTQPEATPATPTAQPTALPSTGEQVKASPIDEEIEIDKGIATALEKESKELEELLNPTATINKLIREELKGNEELQNKSYDEQYNYFKSELLTQGLTEDVIDTYLPKELNSFRFILDKLKNSNLQFSSIDTIIAKIITELDENKIKYYDKLIDLYTEQNNIITSNGISYINIINLMKFVIKESNATFETVNQLYQELIEYINNDKINKTIIIDKFNLNLNRDNLYELVNKKDDIDIQNDNNVGIRFEENEGVIGNITLDKLKPGNKLHIKQSPRGVEFYTPIVSNGKVVYIKIGFNYLPKINKTGDGYITESGNLTYEIKRINGNQFECSLDELFDKLNPANGVRSEEVNKFISLLYNIDDLTDEDYIWFYNSEFGNILYNLYKDKNKNKQNAKSVLNTIKNIYLYNENDNYDENYASYVNFIAKQYYNFKMTNDIYNNIENYEVTVKEITSGKVLYDINIEPEEIDKAIANFNYNDFHLQIIPSSGEIQDVVTGSIKIKAGFNRTNMLIAIPNGTNEAHYSKIIPQVVDINKGIGQHIRLEVSNLIKAKQQGLITYNELRDKLLSIFGIKNFINGVNCIEYNDKIIIASNGSKIPAITIYKYKNKTSEIGNGITINPTEESKKGVSYNGYNNEIETELNQLLDNLFTSATYSMSYDIAKSTSNNSYIKFDKDGSFTLNFNSTPIKYNNYLNYIIKNKAGKIRLKKITSDYGESNFISGKGTKAARQLKIEYRDTSKDIQTSPPVEGMAEQQRAVDIDSIAKNANNVSIESVLNVVSSNNPIPKSLYDSLFPNKVDIDIDTNTNAYASYNAKTNKFTLYKNYFSLAKESRDKAVRTLIHEKLHERIGKDGFMKSQKFINEITEIRQAFIDAINNIDNHKELLDIINKNNYIKESYITNLKQYVDPNNPEYKGKTDLYILEEFVVESLTNKDLNEALNNIYYKQVKAETKRPTLWQKIISWIREVLGFDNIKDDTLLANEFKLFAKKFNDVDIAKVEVKEEVKEEEKEVEEETVKEIVEEITDEKSEIQEIDETDIEEIANNINDEEISEIEEYDDLNADDLFDSAIDTNIERISVPSMSAVSNNLNSSERLRYDDSLARGEFNFSCE